MLATRLAKYQRFSRHRLGAVRSASSNSTKTSYSHTADRDEDNDQQKQKQQKQQKQERQVVPLDSALVVDALRHFYRQHQHFVVPYNFKIPSASHPAGGDDDQQQESWPEQLHGVRLGRVMKRFIKELNSKGTSMHRGCRETALQQLRAMGFPVQITNWREFHWEQIGLSALQTYKRIEGHLRVPKKFIVPENDDRYATPTWGYKLGAHVNQLRHTRKDLSKHQLDVLDDMGFIWHASDAKWETQFLPALRKYRELNGHVNVPQMFRVPCEDGVWPRELWRFALGPMVNRTRVGDIYSPQIERFLPELVKLGFSFSSIEITWNEKIFPSLQVFHSVYGHCNVEKHFAVPHESPWPQPAWGVKLGYTVLNIRSRGDFFQLVGRDMEKLEQLGFVWNTAEATWRQRILPSLKAFVQVHGHTNIPCGFIVPASAPWPTETWGTDLGRVASDVSYRRKYADYIEIERSQLEALGFFWATGIVQDDYEDSDSDSDSDSD